MRRAVAGAALALLLADGEARALTFDRGRAEDGRPTLAVQGRIVPGDAERFRAAVSGAPANLLVVLNSPGGAVIDGRDIGRIIRARGFSTLVPARAVCASACFMMFAAGRNKLAEPGAMIGVHSASVSGGAENTSTLGTTTLMARETGAYGVPPAITGRMVTTRPGDMAWLDRAELEAMGAQVAGRAGGSGTRVEPGSPGGAPSDWTVGFEAGRRLGAGGECQPPVAIAAKPDWVLGCRSGQRSGNAGVAPGPSARVGADSGSDWSRGFDAGRAGGEAACASVPSAAANAGDWRAGCRSGQRAGGRE